MRSANVWDMTVLTCKFFSFLWCVSVRLSFLGDVLGLNMGFKLSRILCTAWVHLFGSLQPAS
jgi:hypothetical protein